MKTGSPAAMPRDRLGEIRPLAVIPRDTGYSHSHVALLPSLLAPEMHLVAYITA
jgi:hypothetical protein